MNISNQKTNLSQANTALREKKYTEAIRLYQLALSEHPKLEKTIKNNIKIAQSKIKAPYHKTPPNLEEPPTSRLPQDPPLLEKDNNKIAISIHCFYPELWDTIKNRLTKLDNKFDLFITLPLDTPPGFSNQILNAFPSARIYPTKNTGMDIIPFLSLIPDLVAENYLAICKLHTKKGDGDLATIWRDIMLDSLIGSSRTIESIRNAFSTNKNLIMAGSSCLYQSGPRLMYENKANIEKITKEIYSTSLPEQDWGFFAGTMFWARPKSLEKFSKFALANLNLLHSEYKKDGKLEHAYERFFGLIPALEKGEIGLLSPTSLDTQHYELRTQTSFDWVGAAHIGDVMRQVRRLHEDVTLLRESELFDAEYYRDQIKAQSTEFDLIIHYLTEGTFKNIQPTRYFSPRDYHNIHRDVAKAEIEPFVHYIKNGAKEGRRLLGNINREQEELPHARYVVLNRTKIDWKKLENKETDSSLVSIVIPVFNKSELTIQCLEALKAAQSKTLFEVIIVDNGSTPEEKHLLDQKAKALFGADIKIITNPENYNFALGCNIGFSEANGSTVVFLNNDTTVTHNWLDNLILRLNSSKIGAVQPKLLYPDGTIQCAGVVFSKLSPLGYPIYAGLSSNDNRVNVPRKFQAITAACIAVKYKTFTKLRGFDPTFINGQEDIDFCLRMRELCDQESWYEPESVVYHHESKTPGRGKFIAYNRYTFIKRWGEKISSDDQRYYILDSTNTYDWHIDSIENQQAGISISRPKTAAKKTERSITKWNHRLESSCLARLNSVYSQIKEKVDSCLVTICMPVYNRATIIGASIESVLAQTHNNFQLIVCDDGSQDETILKAKAYADSDSRINVISIEHSGVSAARNKCLDTAKGELIFYLDSDNTWDCNYLRSMATFMLGGKLDSAYCAVKVYGDEPSRNRFIGAEFDWLACASENYIDINCFGHTSKAGAGFRFDTSLRRLVDWDFILSLTAYKSCAFLPYLGVSYYDGNNHIRITNNESKGALIGLNQHIVRSKHSDINVIRANSSELRPNWASLLENNKTPLTFFEFKQAQHHEAIRARGAKFLKALKEIEAPNTTLRIRIKVPAPNIEVAHEWGDYHFANSLQKEFIKQGCNCEVDLLNEWYNEASSNAHVVIVLRGLSRYTPKQHQLNLMWLISHPEKVTDQELEQFDHIFVASEIYAKILSERLLTSVSVLHQAVDPERFNPEKGLIKKNNEILFVGNSRNNYRRIVKDAVSAGLSISIYGSRWEQFVDKELIKGEHIPNKELGVWYGKSGIVLNDHWDDMREFGFISNRLFDATACAARVISDHVEGMENLFENTILTYSDAEDLKNKIKSSLKESPDKLEKRIKTAEKIITQHSFSCRASFILSFITTLSKKQMADYFK